MTRMLLLLIVPMTLDSRKISFWKKMVYSLGPLFTVIRFPWSAMFSQASPEIMAIYHIGVTPAALTTALFVFGFASGPVIYGPLSELFDENHYGDFQFLYVCFSCCCHSQRYSDNYDMSVFSGFVGSATFVVSPAIFSDLFLTRKGYRYFDICWGAFGGPMLAPIFGGFTVKTLVWAGDGHLIFVV